MPFDQWVDVLVTALRELLPEIRASRRGRDVILRYGTSERVVTITDDRGTYWIKTDDVNPMAMLCDSERHDEHTARTFARTIAGGYDAKLSRAFAAPSAVP